MSNHFEWANATELTMALVAREDAPDELNTEDVTQDFALYLGVDGDGLIVEGSAAQLLRLGGRINSLLQQLNKEKVNADRSE